MSSRAPLLRLADRLLQAARPSALRMATAGRIEICPPASARRQARWQDRLRNWLNAGWEPTSPHARWRDSGSDRSLAILIGVRREFVESLADVRTERACLLLERIRAARSLRELWHLRPEVFDLVSRFHAQSEADRRLALLNRHFPTRSPRSGFGRLGESDQ